MPPLFYGLDPCYKIFWITLGDQWTQVQGRDSGSGQVNQPRSGERLGFLKSEFLFPLISSVVVIMKFADDVKPFLGRKRCFGMDLVIEIIS